MDITTSFTDAIVKDVHWSIESLKSFQDERVGRIEKSDFPISECTAIVQKQENGGYSCKIILKGIYDYTYNRDLRKYGVLDEMRLTLNGASYLINADGIGNISLSLTDPQVITLSVNHIQRGLSSDFDNRLLRLVIPVKSFPELDLCEYLGLQIDSIYTSAGLIEARFGKSTYHLFKYERPNTDECYLFIDNLQPDNFTAFRHNTNAMITALGFITGNLYLDEYFYQTINPAKDYEIEYICYQRLEPSAITHQAILDPSRFREYAEHSGQAFIIEELGLNMSCEVFSSLCMKITDSLEFSRCCRLMIEGNQAKQSLLRAGIYSIGLETITGMVNEEHQDKVNPISDKKLAKKVIDKMLLALQEYDGFIDNYGLDILKSKLNNLNAPTNAKKLSKPFEIYGINLTKADLDILNHRNKFLHGTSPFAEDELPGKTLELGLIVARLWGLLNMLMLKYVGYRGHVKNLPAWILHNRKQDPKEALFIII